jgi:hypothetical protein
MAHTDPQPIRQHCHAKGLLDPSCLPAHVGRAQAQGRLQGSVALLYGPASWICAPYLSRRPRVPRGHQDLWRVWADGTPFFPPHHRDVAERPQPPTVAQTPEGFAAWGSRKAGDPRTLSICARPLGPQVWEGLPLHGLPRAGKRAHKAPAPGGSSRSTVLHPLPMLLGALGRIALHDAPLRPRGRDKAPAQLAPQGMFRWVRQLALRSDQTKSPRQAIPVPVGNHQDKAAPEQPWLRRTFTSFLPQRILGPSLRLVTAVTHAIQGPSLRWWQGMQSCLPPPRHQQMDIPVSGCEHATPAPGRDGAWGPAGAFFQSFPPREEGGHAKKPAAHQTVTRLPEAGHAAQQERTKKRPIGTRDQRRPPRAQGVSDHALSIAAVLFYHMPLTTLIYKASWV